MSLASKLGSACGTLTAYVVHYMGKGSTPIGVVTMVYTNRKQIQKFAVKHAINRASPDAVQENIFECLQYID